MVKKDHRKRDKGFENRSLNSHEYYWNTRYFRLIKTSRSHHEPYGLT
jgi:hypothetical protein